MDAQSARADGSTCPGCAARERRIAGLEARIGQFEGQSKDPRQRLERLTVQLDAANRSAKRQAAPFARGPPKTHPKSPGRKRGDAYGPKAFRPVPPVIDEVYDAPLPARCPQCGGPIAFSHTDHQYQVEMPRRPFHRQFNVAVGHCPCCRKRVQGRSRRAGITDIRCVGLLCQPGRFRRAGGGGDPQHGVGSLPRQDQPVL